MKQKFMTAIMFALILTLSIINVHGIAFAHRHHDYQDDSSKSYSQQPYYQQASDNYAQDNQAPDNSDSSSHIGPVGKTICSAAASLVGSTLGNALLPGLGGLIGGAAGSKICENQ
jgi:sortase (surface protein transpeptidase)